MSREYTVFQFDVDEAAVRRLLARIPGVTPLPPDERAASEDHPKTSQRETGRVAADAASDTPTETSDGETGAPTSDAAGVEAHLGDTAGPGASRAGATKWTGPSTPWPGAPTEEQEDESGSLVDRLRSNRVLIAGVALGLGAVGAAAAWFLKFRGDDEPDRAGGQAYHPPGRPAEGTAARSERDASARDPPADDSESRSYPVDAAPVIGIAFLAVASLVLRYVRSRTAS